MMTVLTDVYTFKMWLKKTFSLHTLSVMFGTNLSLRFIESELEELVKYHQILTC